MPKRLLLAERWLLVVEANDFVLTTFELSELGFTLNVMQQRVTGGAWKRLLPGVYLLRNGEPTRRQLLIAALKWAGPEAVIDSHDSCRFHGYSSPGWRRDMVHVVVPHGSRARSRGFVRVRRTSSPVTAIHTGLCRYLPAAEAVLEAARDLPTERDATAFVCEVVRLGTVDAADLAAAFDTAPAKGRGHSAAAVRAACAGALSAPEADVLALVARSVVLPDALINQRLRLPGGRLVLPDILFESSGVVHETNGRRWHAGEDRFESMQERHDAMTAAGLIVLHNSPRRIQSAAREVLAELERTHQRYAGRGLPDGVTLLTAHRALAVSPP